MSHATQVQQAVAAALQHLPKEDAGMLLELVELAGDDPTALIAMLEQLKGLDFKWHPVDMETFLLDEQFLGLRGQLYPKLIEDLVELFSGGYSEGVLTGGIGWGKSTVAECALARMVYEVSCLRDPQRAYGLMTGSKIAFINASVSLGQATNVVFHGIKQRLENSPYFTEHFPLEALKREIRFPNNIWLAPLAASEGGTVGYNVFGGVLDEVNFWDVIEKSSQNRGQRFDQARTVYTMLMRRIKSRFNRAGKLPGVLLQVSSSKYPDDFTEQRIVEAADEPQTFVRRYSTWTTKPAEQFSPERFYVYRGTTAERPHLSKDPITDKPAHLVLQVPMDYHGDFARDIDGSIRDLGGYPTLAIKPFIPQKDKIMEAIALGERLKMRHPYSVDVTSLEDGAKFDPALLTFDPSTFYYAHVDLALRKDACGVAVGHVAEWVTVSRRAGDLLVQDVAPRIVIDFMLKVQAPVGGEIQVDSVRAVLLELRARGCNLHTVTYDQYQSASSIQAFQRLGIESDRMSVDRPLDPYNAFKEAFLENRIAVYNYTPFLDEIVRLELNEAKKKVDHPAKGSKDVTDAVCGVVYHCTLAKRGQAAGPQLGSLHGTWDRPEGAAPSSPEVKTGGAKAEEARWDPFNMDPRVRELEEKPEDDSYGFGFA